MPRIGLLGEYGRYEGVSKVLSLIRDEVVRKLRSSRTILVKPNFVSAYVPACATHVEAVRAFLDFVYESVGSLEVIIAEAPAVGTFEEALKNYGYLALAEHYDIEFVDLNKDDYEIVSVYDSSLRKSVEVPVSRTLLDADCRVSICRPKTHDTVVVTLTIKNMAVGAILTPHKPKIHQGYGAINLSIADLASLVMPHIAIIDGYEAMEGDGPVTGRPFEWRVYVAGLNAVEVDALTAWLMGFEPHDVGYLWILHRRGYGEIDVNKLVNRIIGDDPRRLRRRFMPHRRYREQLRWKEELGVDGHASCP